MSWLGSILQGLLMPIFAYFWEDSSQSIEDHTISPSHEDDLTPGPTSGCMQLTETVSEGEHFAHAYPMCMKVLRSAVECLPDGAICKEHAWRVGVQTPFRRYKIDQEGATLIEWPQLTYMAWESLTGFGVAPRADALV